MRAAVLIFSVCVCTYAIVLQGTPIYEMVSGAYQVTLVGAFIPLVFGLYWPRATTQGAVFSMVLGILTWVLFLAPAGVPKEIVARLSAETARALNSPDLRARFEALGLEPVGSTPDQAVKFLDDEIVKWGKVITSAGVKAE